MKAIILAAGQGTRLRPLTDEIPKCMVEIAGKPILHRQLSAIREAGINKIVVLTGYQSERVKAPDIEKLHNPNYDKMNMVGTLFSNRKVLTGDILISYGDIVCSPAVIKAVIDSPHDIAVGVDTDWKRLWSLRMEDPLEDAETLKLGQDGNIKELGNKPTSLDDIEGQYIGLIKVSAEKIPQIEHFYDSLDKSATYQGRNFENMFMTAFLSALIEDGQNIHPAFFSGGWCEIDSVEDLQAYESANLAFLS